MKPLQILKNDDIFWLVHSMTANEKRFFKLMHRHNGEQEKQYLKAFDLIAAQEQYDEPALRIAIRNYGVIKNQLFDLILKCLRNLPSAEQSPSVALKNEIIEIKILADLGLLERAMKRLQKAKQKALENERHPELLELLHLEIMMLNSEADIVKMNKLRHDIQGATKNSLAALEDLFAALLLNYDFIILQKRLNLARDMKEKSLYEELLVNPAIAYPENGLSLEAKLTCLLIKAAITRVQGEVKKSYAIFEELLDEAMRYPKVIGEIPNIYVAITYSNLLSANRSNDKSKVQAMHKLLRNLPVKSDYFQNKATFLSYMFECNLFCNRNELKKAKETMTELEELIQRRRMRLSPEEKIFYRITSGDIFFLLGEYEHASDCFRQIIYNKEFDKIRMDNGALIRMMYLLAQFEKGEMEYMRSLLRPFRNFLKKANRYHKPEKIIFDFFSKWNPANSEMEKKKTYGYYLKEMEKLLDNAEDAIALNYYFDWISWFRSKLTGESFAKTMAERDKRLVKQLPKSDN